MPMMSSPISTSAKISAMPLYHLPRPGSSKKNPIDLDGIHDPTTRRRVKKRERPRRGKRNISSLPRELMHMICENLKEKDVRSAGAGISAEFLQQSKHVLTDKRKKALEKHNGILEGDVKYRGGRRELVNSIYVMVSALEGYLKAAQEDAHDKQSPEPIFVKTLYGATTQIDEYHDEIDADLTDTAPSRIRGSALWSFLMPRWLYTTKLAPKCNQWLVVAQTIMTKC